MNVPSYILLKGQSSSIRIRRADVYYNPIRLHFRKGYKPSEMAPESVI